MNEATMPQKVNDQGVLHETSMQVELPDESMISDWFCKDQEETIHNYSVYERHDKYSKTL